MKKIPTLFVRDEVDRRYVTPQVTPGCEWVLAGEGIPTRKFDGTCVLIRYGLHGTEALCRREVKAGKETPPNFEAIEHDPVTGKTVGWEPSDQSGFARYVNEAIYPGIQPGTYELIGPRINGNPENWSDHALIRHGVVALTNPDPLTFETLRDALLGEPFEGIVWHHPDGRMAKLKRRDFPR